MKKPGHLWLLGLSGSGKTTIGPLLAGKLHLPFHDTDEIIAQSASLTIPTIFSREGEAGFRRRETAALREMKTKGPAVIACGGGAVLAEENRKIMQRTGTRIYLRVPMELLEKRLRPQADRPLLAGGSLSGTLSHQLAQREPWYRESEILIEASEESPEELAEKIFACLPTVR